jgi:hypothetical protein
VDANRTWRTFSLTAGRPHPICRPLSRNGENPPYGISGGAMETSASFEAWSAPSPYPTTARKQAVKIQLRNLPPLRCRRRSVWWKAASGYDRNCEGRPGIAGVVSSGHVSKGISHEPRRAPISARKSGKTAAKGDRRRPRTGGRAVLRPRITYEGGEPQGFRKERPRHPLEGRGEQGDVSVEGNISETQNSSNYVHTNRQTN